MYLMKLVVLILTACAAFAFANVAQLGAVHPEGDPTPGSDAVVFAQTYSFGTLLNGFRHIEAADDFIVGTSCDLQNIRIWMIYSGGMPTDYDLRISMDAGDSDPNNATDIWTETVPCTHVDTGDDNWGFDIYETTCAIPAMDAYPSVTAGQRYWLELVFKGDEYWLVSGPVWGSFCWTSDGTTWTRADDPGTFATEADFYFDLYDTPVALQRETWGSIKSIF